MIGPSVAKLTEGGCASGEAAGKVCRSRGGESCAFDGAMIVLQPIADAAHLVHGPITCLGNSWEGRGSLSDKGELHRMGFTTDMRELDIVYGASEKLHEAIMQTHARVRPKAIFVYSTCVSGLIGEDIEEVCRRASINTGIPVIPVNAPGFVGPKNLGNRIAGQALIDHVIGTKEPEFALTGAEINIIGEYNIAGDLMLVEPLLNEAGIRVLSRMSGNASFDEIRYAHRARLSVLVCGRALINVAQSLHERYGIPYIEGSFFGMSGMSQTLRQIAAALGDEAITQNVERIIQREEARVQSELLPYAYLRSRKAVLYSGGVKSWAMIMAMRDLGLELSAVGVKKSSSEDERRVRELVGDSAEVLEDTTPGNLLKAMRASGAELMIAGGRNLYLGVKEGFPFVDVNQERHSAYAGYEGLVNLARDIHAAMQFHGLAPVSQSKAIAPTQDNSALLVDPLKHSASLGAVMAMQGVDRALPIWHGAQGCNFLGKVLLTKHFREPISVISSKLFVEDVVMGSEERLVKVASDAMAKSAPQMVAIISSALSEVKGDDMRLAITQISKSGSTPVIHVSTPDYEGDMESGYASAVDALCALAERSVIKSDAPIVNIIAGPQLSPTDFTELREIARSFGYQPILLPDLSALDGSRQAVGQLTSGGTSMEQIRTMGNAELTLSIGACVESAAKRLSARFDMRHIHFNGINCMKDTDALLEALSAASGRTIPERYQRQRLVLRDALRDASFILSGKRACVALDTSHAIALSALLSEAGMSVPLAVIPDTKPYASLMIADAIKIGGLGAVSGEFDLIISNSHATGLAARLNLPLYQIGFPSYKSFGRSLRQTIGYAGAMDSISDLANLLMEVH